MTAIRLDFALLALLFVTIGSSQIIIRTDKGFVSGKEEVIDGRTVYSYLGIPYVQPPIGNLRFMPPKPLTSSWNGVLNGSQFKNSCPQFTPIVGVPPNSPQSKINEDCLYINVFTTKPSAAANMSVLVWIHGGGFIVGSGANWQMQTLAATQGIVIVTMNYRLGAFGFLTSGHDNPSNHSIPPNLGILDQQMALQWVQNNIEDFGGNKDAVTLAGFSAGAFSAGLHIVIPSSQGLFRSAIMNSAGVLDTHTYNNMGDARSAFLKFAKQAGCNSTTTHDAITQCVRNLSVQQILKATPQMLLQDFGFCSVTVDGKLVPKNPRTLWAAGQFNKGKLLIGVSAQDGYINVPAVISRPAFITSVGYFFTRVYNSQGRTAIINRYTNYIDINSPLSNGYMLGELSTDCIFVAPVDFVAQYHSVYSPTYVYVFSHRTIEDGYSKPYMGATHGVDIPYIFGYPIRKPKEFLSNYTTAEADLSRDIMALWGNFIRTG